MSGFVGFIALERLVDIRNLQNLLDWEALLISSQQIEVNPYIKLRIFACAHFPTHTTISGMTWRRLEWLLCKDNMQIHEAFHGFYWIKVTWWQLNTRIGGVITLQGVKMANHYIVYLKLI